MKLMQLQNRFHGFFLKQSLFFILLISSTQVTANPTLLVLGDSLSAGYGMPADKSWVSLLAQKLETLSIQVVNASISGETSSGGKQRLPKLIEQYQPKWLILELGANDALRGQNLKSTERNLQTMLSLCRQNNCEALLLGIKLPTNYGPAYEQALAQMYQRLAERNQVNFDPFFLETVALDPDLMQLDGLHPNQQAQPLILQRLWSQISGWVSEAKRQ